MPVSSGTRLLAAHDLIGNAFADAILESKLIDRVMDGRRAARNPSPRVAPIPDVGLRAASR
ncbi:MAG: hypothetical protein ACREHD_11020 [Pirellulales bacterium]